MKINKSKQALLLVGAEHFFSTYITEELDNRNYPIKILKSNLYGKENYTSSKSPENSLDIGDTLKLHFNDVKNVISSIEGSTLFDLCICYKNNIRLIQESKKNNVKKIVFVFSNVCSLQKNEQVICEKNRFLLELKKSGLNYTIVRTNGIFSNFIGFLNMAFQGKIFLSGNVNENFSPIHLKDLANACIDAIEINEMEICIEGPEILNLYRIAEIAFCSIERPSKIILIPKTIERILKIRKNLFPLNFCVDLITEGCTSLQYGSNSLEAYFKEEAEYYLKQKKIGV